MRISNEYQFPMDAERKHFSPNLYSRKPPNGECVDRRWLIYSKTKDAVFFFSCKLYGSPQKQESKLASEGHCN